MCTLTSWRRIPPSPPPEKFGAAASRILVGAPARQPDLGRASRKTDGGAAEGSTAGGVLGHAHRRRCGRWAGGAGGVLDYAQMALIKGGVFP